MATQTFKMVIQFRRDTAENWNLHKDVVPAPGEPCFVTDKNILKIGDGVKTFEELESIGGDSIKLSADEKSIVLENDVFKLMGFDAAEVGAQPQKSADGSIEWVMPVDITELETKVTDLQSDVDELQATVSNLQEIVTPSGDDAVPLPSRVEILEEKMDGQGEGSVDAKINAKINEFANQISDDGTVNTLKELINYVANHGGELETLVADINNLQTLVGDDPVSDQINTAISKSGHITKTEAESTFISKTEASETLLNKVEAAETYITKVESVKTFERVKYEIADTPVGTLVDYKDNEIRIMIPNDSQFAKQSVGAGGDSNTYYVTFKTYAPNDQAVGYIEHLDDQSDKEILTNFSVDQYGRRYQSTWLGVAKYNETTSEWDYYGKKSSISKYTGWDYQIDWYDVNGVIIASDTIRINLSNESCHNAIEPYYMANTIKGVSVNGTLLDAADGIVNIEIAEQTLGVKGSDEIDVAEDGTLTVKTISFDKIAQDKETIIVMDGGTSSI